MASDTGQAGAPGPVFTIGHSNHDVDRLIGLMAQHAVDVVADVRSVPRSGYSPQFDRSPFERSLTAAGIRYVFLGIELGGRPPEDRFYDEDGHVRYDLVAGSPRFLGGLDRLITGMGLYRVAVLCSEENPAHCHRRLLIGRVLTERGAELRHIRADGAIETEHEVPGPVEDAQPNLFGEPEAPRWRSTRSVSRNGQRQTSSAPSATPGSGDWSIPG